MLTYNSKAYVYEPTSLTSKLVWIGLRADVHMISGVICGRECVSYVSVCHMWA